MDQEEYIDLDKVLVDDELRSLVSTCEYNHKFRISLKSMDERKTERFRRSLVTPLSKYNTDWRTTTNKSPNDSCAESVALFKNLANNNDHIDFVSSDLKDFMSSYDMDDLLSRPNSRVPALSHQKDVLTSSRLNNHNQATTLRHTNNSHMVPHKSSIINLSETIPRKHSFDSGQRKLSSPSIPVISDTSETQEINNNAKNQQFHRLLHKRRSVDSDALKKMKQADRDTKLKKPIVLVDKQKSIKHVSSTAIPTPKANRKSLLQQSDKRRWSSYIPDDMDLKKSPLISPKQGPVNTSRRTNNETLNRQKPFNSHLVSPQLFIRECRTSFH
ncbi:uncharacterized protein B0P05DRAFT_67866 [Gilbertella persicaria]|uniref:uncharacterized protein n=1 Tax=Gilbertella persicaria TaxID=101096 RepID=UPI0022206A22|nr:uncharacterized protein B0P05DRAFT_67866 [Gilbertella persicaria]KAI8081977.1 hypothetical protein B0P05DRAFT_67866 [Gilbertella persicaria]